MLIHSPKELALLVISERKTHKLSQADVADRVGLKQKTISAFENKPEAAKLDTIFRILSAVDLDIRLLSKDKALASTSGWREEW